MPPFCAFSFYRQAEGKVRGFIWVFQWLEKATINTAVDKLVDNVKNRPDDKRCSRHYDIATEAFLNGLLLLTAAQAQFGYPGGTNTFVPWCIALG